MSLRENKKYRYIILLLLLASLNLASQENTWDSLYQNIPTTTDSLRLEALNALTYQSVLADPSFTMGIIDEQYELAGILSNELQKAKVYNVHGIYHNYHTGPDSAIYYFDKALVIYESEDHLTGAAMMNNNIGIMLRKLGDFDGALQRHLEALKLFEELGDSATIFKVHNAIGIAYKSINDYDKAEAHYRKVLGYSIWTNNEVSKADALSNIGNILEDEPEAIRLNQEAADIYKSHDLTYKMMASLQSIGHSYHELENYPKALEYYAMVRPLAEEMESIHYLATLLRDIGDAENKLGLQQEALPNMERAAFLLDSIGEYRDYVITLEVLHKAQAEAGSYPKAYHTFLKYHRLNDSIKSVEVLENMSELETKYETEKKEAQIVLLNKQTELDSTRKKALWGGLILLTVLAGGIIYGQVQRRKKIQAIAEKEKQIEIEKRKSSERELEFKKKELLAKVLQLAQKNEFLQSLEEQVSALKSSADDSVNTTSRRIRRMISNDALDANEWDQFAEEFSSIHQDFIATITEKYGAFSQTELRLASLLKMNLSSKDIASILRISDAGIKKARYRLRKKMGLETGEDLQAIIVAI
ncbi:MAG: tetratricopeptide repeat protein [Saprospiraceae bacterium]|nr:tetratricopeptide repeat protein [Saprospiraceae bacterium]